MADKDLGKKMGRAGFFKVAGVLVLGGAGALANADRVAKALTDEKLLADRETAFSTELAEFYPFYENHFISMPANKILNVRPDYIFTEFSFYADKTLNLPTGQLLQLKSVQGERVTDENLLKSAEDLNTRIVYEGVWVPIDLVAGYAAIKGATALPSNLWFLNKSIDILKTIAERKPVDSNDVAKTIAAGLISGLTAGDIATTVGALAAGLVDDKLPGAKLAKNLAERVNSTVTITHPENIIIFLRNILMSLKLQTLAEQDPKGVDGKPKIAFKTGVGHSAMTDLLQYGREISTKLLGIYPDALLRHVIETNVKTEMPFEEKITEFCKVLIVDLKRAKEYGDGKIIILDHQLRDYFFDRLIPKGQKDSREMPGQTGDRELP